MTRRIGILTAGGDAAGLNAAIRAVVRTAIGVHGFEVLGFRRGWRGVMDGDVIELTSRNRRIALRFAELTRRGESTVTALCRGMVAAGTMRASEREIAASSSVRFSDLPRPVISCT